MERMVLMLSTPRRGKKMNEIIIIIINYCFMFLGVWMTLVNISKLIYKQGIPPINFYLWTLGIVGTLIMYKIT